MIKMKALREFSPNNIVLKDDALHKTRRFANVETWYYDAMFDNNYSMVTLVNIIRISNIGIVLTGLFIYKNAKLIKSKRSRTFFKHFYGSEEKPLIKINDKKIIYGEVDKETDQWVYHICMGDQSPGVNLNLIKTAKPWMGKTFLGNWLVIPRFKVDGEIFLDGNSVKVSGEGYHDHNIYPLYAPFFNKGYHFGKIRAGEVNVVWARVTRDRNNEEVLVVLNKDQDFISIPSENIEFIIEEKIKNHGKTIPTKYNLKVDNKLLNLNVEIESIDFHHISIPAVNYWRHHVRNKGEIIIDSFSKKIDNIEISEQLKFL